MARIILSALVEDMFGKINGSVIQSSNGGLQLRTRVSPRNPSSLYQQQRRAQQSVIYSNWANLSTEDRDSWFDHGLDFPQGIELFTAVNQRIFSAGQSFLSVYSASGSPSTVTFSADELTETTFTVVFDGSPFVLPTDVYAVLFCSSPRSAGVRYISPHDHRLISVIAPGNNVGDPFDIQSAYVARLGDHPEASIIGIGAFFINVASGLYDLTGYTINQVVTP